MALLDKMRDPNRLQMALMGLGLLGSKRQSQADRYMTGLNTAFGNLAKARQAEEERKLRERQLTGQEDLWSAQARRANAAAAYDVSRANAPAGGLWDGTGASVNAMRIVSQLGAKLQRQEQLTPQEQMTYQTARNYLAQMRVTPTPDGPMYTMPMDMSHLPGIPGQAVATPVEGSGTSGFQPTAGLPPLPEAQPLRDADANRVVESLSTAEKYSGMMPMFDAIEQDLAKFPTGKFSSLELALRGWDDALFGFGEEDILASGERLDKNINKLVSQNMEFLVGAMSEGERQFTRTFSLGMGTSVEGNKAYIEFLRAVAKRASKKGNMQRKYFEDNNNSLSGWEDHWAKYIEDNPVPIPKIEAIDAPPPGAPEGAQRGDIWYDDQGNMQVWE